MRQFALRMYLTIAKLLKVNMYTLSSEIHRNNEIKTTKRNIWGALDSRRGLKRITTKITFVKREYFFKLKNNFMWNNIKNQQRRSRLKHEYDVIVLFCFCLCPWIDVMIHTKRHKHYISENRNNKQTFKIAAYANEW